MKKITLIIISLIMFSILNSYLVTPQTEEADILAEEIETAQDLSQVYTKGRLFLSILSIFNGGTCGDNVCGENEFDCLADCGKFIAKNGIFGGDIYKGESSYEGIKYEFEINGDCAERESSSTVRESITKGGIISPMKVAVEYNNQIETFNDVKDNTWFELGNGKRFFINSFSCNSIGFLEVNLADSEAVCGDNVCWGVVKEPTCPEDCGNFLVRFYVDKEKFKPVNSEVTYQGYEYKFEVVSTQDYVPNCRVDKTAKLSVSYNPINNPSVQSTEEFTLTSPVDNFKLGNGMEFQASMPCSGPYIDKKMYILSLKAI